MMVRDNGMMVTREGEFTVVVVEEKFNHVMGHLGQVVTYCAEENRW